jgi:hypothetical protein
LIFFVLVARPVVLSKLRASLERRRQGTNISKRFSVATDDLE